MYTLNMLEVLAPGVDGPGYCKRYINGRRVGQMRWDLAGAHAQAKDCFQTTKRKGKWYYRHVIRCPIDFSK